MANKTDIPFHPGCTLEVRTDDKKSFETDSCVLILSTRIPMEVARTWGGRDIAEAISEAIAKVVADRGGS